MMLATSCLRASRRQFGRDLNNSMNSMGNMLIIVGVALIIFGLIFSGKLGPLGRLPGDIIIERDSFSFYFPLATSILLSVILSALLWSVA